MHFSGFILFFLIGIANGFINVTGGGGGLITAPLLLALGLNPYATLATSKFVPIGGLIIGGAKYYKEKIVKGNKLLLILSLIVSLGAVIAANLTLRIDAFLLKYIILVATSIIILLIIFKRSTKNVTKSYVKEKSLQYPGVLFWTFIVSLYQGSIGIGGGIFLAAVFRQFMQYSYLESAALMNVLAVLITIISAVTFTIKGVVNYEYGIPLFLGSIVGGYIGAVLAINKGEKLIKIITIAVSLGLIVKVLLT